MEESAEEAVVAVLEVMRLSGAPRGRVMVVADAFPHDAARSVPVDVAIGLEQRLDVLSGVSAWMLWAVQKMKPPPGPSVSKRSRTSLRTSSGVPKGSVRWIEIDPWKDSRSPKSRFSFGACHVARLGLDRVQDVQAALDQVGNDRLDRAAGMVGDLAAVALAQIDERLETGPQKPPPHLGRHEQARLRAEIVARHEDVEPAAGRFEGPPGVFQVEVGDAPEDVLGDLGLMRPGRAGSGRRRAGTSPA